MSTPDSADARPDAVPPAFLYAARVRMAFNRWRMFHPDASTQADLGRRVGELVGKRYSQNAVSDWLKGAVPRRLEEMDAFAMALGVDPGWLYFAGHSVAEPPVEIAGVWQLTRMEGERDYRAAQEETAAAGQADHAAQVADALAGGGRTAPADEVKVPPPGTFKRAEEPAQPARRRRGQGK